MVHRKSTYKLSFKNINEKMRKSIWEENTVMREKRRTDEMSHHSIDDDDSECECDTSEETEENESSDKQRLPCSRQSHEEPKKSLLHERKGTPVSHLMVPAERVDSEKLVTKGRTSFTEKVCDTTSNRNEEEHSEAEENGEKDDVKHNVRGSELSRTWEDKTKYKSFNLSGKMKQDRRYLSETNLEQLTREVVTAKGNRGVMKFSPLTGEFDLIPSRLGEVKSSKQDSACERQCRKFSTDARNSRNVINIRPRTSVGFASRCRSSRPNEFHACPGAVTTSRMDFDLAKRELVSTRKEPRLNTAQKAKKVLRTTDCICCGQAMKLRGIMT